MSKAKQRFTDFFQSFKNDYESELQKHLADPKKPDPRLDGIRRCQYENILKEMTRIEQEQMSKQDEKS